MAETAVSVTISLIETVITFLSHEVNHTFGQVVVDDVKTSLTEMQACLQDAQRGEGGEVMKDLIRRIQNVALEIEDVLDEFMLHAPRHNFRNGFFQKMYKVGHYGKRWKPLHVIKSKMKDIREKISSIKTSHAFAEFLRTHSFVPEGSQHDPSSHHMSTPEILQDDEILGMQETKGNIIRQLINNQMTRRTVVVVGPAGSGKTILVNNIFRSNNIQGKFECCAWLNVPLYRSSSSSVAVNADLSRRVLAQYQIGTYEEEISLNELGRKLRGKKYIVIVDDIQNEWQWRCIERELPNEPNDSRVIVTTINTEVATACAEFTYHIHKIDGLAWGESWTLFCQKAFKSNQGKCPPELVDLAQKIVKRCEGIPFLISAAGSLLSRKRPLPAEWEKVHQNLGPEIENSSRKETISNMLLRSYRDLPSNHKSCFLYFSIFPEDYSIGRSRLIRLWVAEGFVKKTGRKTLEETAEDYLNELVARNLIQACSRDCDGRIRSCRVLHLVREFAIMKSEEENFAEVLTESGETESSEKLRRLSIHNLNLEIIRGNANLNHVRTLSAFGRCEDVSTQIRVTNEEFRLLRVLDLQSSPMQHFPRRISEVVLLRYLSLRGTNVTGVPGSIQELHYLEYLDLKHTKVTFLPKGICSLQKLRHLLVYSDNATNSFTFDNVLGADILEPIGALHSLQKLTLIKAKGKEFFTELGRLKQLQKLGLVELRERDGKHLCESIKKMKNISVLNLRSAGQEEYLDLDYMNDFSSNLQRLYLKGRLRALPRWINQSLSSVVKIKLKRSLLTETLIEVLQVLPNLMELHMSEAFLGEVLIFETGSFQKLKTLHNERFYC